jgi:HAD superfamily hydrolase (TIGR01509 family)
LEALEKAGIPKAIATSAPRANVDFTLEKTGTGKYFKTILDEAFVSKGKPDPEIYLLTAKAVGLPPQNCIVIEDSLSGVKAGKGAGCKVIGITTTHTREELSDTDLIIDNFQNLQLPTLFSALFQ